MQWLVHRFRRRTLTTLLFVVLFSTGATAETVYRLGVVPQFSPGDIHRIWGPLVAQLNTQLPFRLQLHTAADIAAFEDKCESGNYDFAYVNPYHLLTLHAQQGYQPILSDPDSAIYGILVSKKGSGIDQVKQLTNQELAFPAPNALGASLLIRRDLQEKLKIPFQSQYVHSHSSVYLNVALGLAKAGGGVQKTLARQPAHIREHLQVIYRTETVPSHPLVVHPRVDAQVTLAVQNAFLALAATDIGQALLKKVPIKTLAPVSFDDYRSLQQLGLDAYYEDGRE